MANNQGNPASSSLKKCQITSQLVQFNPLDKKNLGISVADALLACDVGPLAPEQFEGAGIYAIYYVGDSFSPYLRLAERNRGGRFELPIYVGKAVPAGARKGGFGLGTAPGRVLHRRIAEHAETVRSAQNLRAEDFFCRFLVVDDIWIPLGESLLIQQFTPVWNRVVDGFGNHDPGSGRYNQKRSRWDTLHPGRAWVDKCQQNDLSPEQIIREIEAFLDARLS